MAGLRGCLVAGLRGLSDLSRLSVTFQCFVSEDSFVHCLRKYW